MANSVSLNSDCRDEPWTLVKGVKKIIGPIKENRVALVSISDDGLSLLKDSMSLADYVSRSTPTTSSTPVAPFQGQALNNLTCITASLGAFLGSYEVQRGEEAYYRSKEILDGEGENRARARLFSGWILINASVLSLMGKITDVFSSSASAGIGFSSNILGGIGSAFAMGMASLGLYRCYSFRSELNQKMGGCELDALQFLLDTAFVNEGDREKIERELPPALKGKERERVLNQRLLDRAEEKVNAFKRRVSTKGLNLLRSQAVFLKEELKDEKTRAAAIEKTRALFNVIKRENSKKMVLFSVALVTATVAFAVFCLGFFVSAGSLPLILSVGISAVCLISGLTSFVSEKLSKNIN